MANDQANPVTITAQAQPNIALVKYWGKRDRALNLPAAGSLSITLDALFTRTTVCLAPDQAHDSLLLNGSEHPATLARVSACLDVLRERAGNASRMHVETANNFPTAAGLASSASGYAALVVAASEALGLPLERGFLSGLARFGSGSAARSLFGGFVLMHAGVRDDGEDARAEPLLAPEEWPLSVVVAITTHQAKSVGSGEGMQRTRLTSPYHQAWVDTVDADLIQARDAIARRDFEQLAEVSEHSCLKMHADMLATRPPLMYWNAASVACMQRIRELRMSEGLGVFFTVDAGPQVKAVCLPQDAERVAVALAQISGVEQILTSSLGQGARVVPVTETV